MLLREFRRFVTWLARSSTTSLAVQTESASDSSTVFDFDPMWHGDHWQNLLSSPMDARRYVMEDWTVPAAPDWDSAEGAAPAH